ncbi:uncharacterized protein LOC126683065 [Mercurialis annua]|uniref:uncharacterized protein LOC126683065 n=1 Tax=Mercurialis annua TaxID=3986 RepID=UPI00215F319B|nr:uncharacterized protein LOC126683065 [Mercurialis annua]
MRPVGNVNVPANCKERYFLQNNGCWDEEKLNTCFSHDDISNILKIPMSRNLPPNKLFWTLTKNGFYSVKSGYHQACKSLSRNQTSSSSSRACDILWLKNSCSLKDLPEMRDCRRNSALCSKGMQCCWGLWLLSPLNTRVDLFVCSNMTEWLHHIFNSLKDDVLHVLILSLWTVWTNRNNLIFGNCKFHSKLYFAMLFPCNDGSASDRISKAIQPAVDLCWKPPPVNSIKINIDAAISSRINLVVVSVVCRSSSGAVIRRGLKVMNCLTEVDTAEAQALLFGVLKILKPDESIDPIQLITDDCVALMTDRRVHFQHVRNQCNQVAHALAKWSICIGKDCIIDDNFPFSVNELVNSF